MNNESIKNLIIHQNIIPEDIENMPMIDFDDSDNDNMASSTVDLEELENENNDSSIPKCTKYMIKDGHYLPIQQVVNELPAGYYKPERNHFNGEIYASPKKVNLPKLYDLPNDIHEKVVNDIKKFWESEERYKQFGNVYKRNILLYSVPGNGKTCLINILARDLIKNYNGIIMILDDEESLEIYPKLMQELRQIEPERKVITVIEDFERLIKKDYLSSLLLQILDGTEVLSGVVTIATSNYPDQIGEQYMSRPSRFNLKIEYKKPDAKVRKYYITQKLIDSHITIDDKVAADIDRYVEKTEGYTFDFLKEAIQGIYLDCIPEDKLFDDLDTAIKKKGCYHTTESNGGKLGF